MSKYTFCYFAGALYNLGLWGLCYVFRKDLRRELVVMSCAAVAMGLPHEYLLWTRDWWHPPNITHTRIGVEDLLYAIATGGTLAVIYPVTLRRRLFAGPAPRAFAVAMPLIVNFVLPLLLVPLAGLHSFKAGALSTCLAILWILIARPDLIGAALISAVLGWAVSFSSFWLIEAFVPGVVAAVWDLPKLSGIVLAGVPFEDLAWYAYTAALFGIYYKYATGARVVNPAADMRDRDVARPSSMAR